MKKWMALALALVMALTLAACGGGNTQESGQSDADTEGAELQQADEQTPADGTETPDVEPADETTPDDAESAGSGETSTANPFTEYTDYTDAETAAGFSFGVPEEIGGYDSVVYRVAPGLGMFEVVYSNDASELTARKAPGSLDISGDYNQYTVESVEAFAGVNVTCFGDGDSLFLATWTMDNYSYALSTSENIDRMDFIGIAETIINLNAAS